MRSATTTTHGRAVRLDHGHDLQHQAFSATGRRKTAVALTHDALQLAWKRTRGEAALPPLGLDRAPVGVRSFGKAEVERTLVRIAVPLSGSVQFALDQCRPSGLNDLSNPV